MNEIEENLEIIRNQRIDLELREEQIIHLKRQLTISALPEIGVEALFSPGCDLG